MGEASSARSNSSALDGWSDGAEAVKSALRFALDFFVLPLALDSAATSLSASESESEESDSAPKGASPVQSNPPVTERVGMFLAALVFVFSLGATGVLRSSWSQALRE